jgi:hypothetical protein
LITAPTALPGTGMVMVMAGLNVAEAAPVSCTSTAPDVEAKVVKPVGTGTPCVPDAVAVESAGAVKVKESGEVSAFAVPSAFFAAMVVPAGSVAETVARYPGVPLGVVTVVAVAPVVAVPFVMVAVKVLVVAEGFVTTGVSSPPPPHPPAIIKAPSKAAMPIIFISLAIIKTSLCYKILALQRVLSCELWNPLHVQKGYTTGKKHQEKINSDLIP